MTAHVIASSPGAAPWARAGCRRRAMLIAGRCHCGSHRVHARLDPRPGRDPGARVHVLVLRQARRRVDVVPDRHAFGHDRRSVARRALRVRHAHRRVPRLHALRRRAAGDEPHRRRHRTRWSASTRSKASRGRCCAPRRRASTARARMRGSRAGSATGSATCASSRRRRHDGRRAQALLPRVPAGGRSRPRRAVELPRLQRRADASSPTSRPARRSAGASACA